MKKILISTIVLVAVLGVAFIIWQGVINKKIPNVKATNVFDIPVYPPLLETLLGTVTSPSQIDSACTNLGSPAR